MAHILLQRFRKVGFVVSMLMLSSAALGMLASGQQAEAAPSETLAKYRTWMQDARKVHPYSESVDKMYRVMMCESTGNARAVGDRGASLGLFQYRTSTWRGKWNPYRNSSIWDPKTQIFATAKAWSIGMQSHWTCYRKTR
jgi:hypothetical protein